MTRRHRPASTNQRSINGPQPSPAARIGGVHATRILEVPGGWDDVFEGAARQSLERWVLPDFLRSQRWFGGKARTIASVRVADRGSLPGGPAGAFLVLLDVRFADGARDLYFLPLAVTAGPAAKRLHETMRPWVLARLTGPGGEAVLHDALADDAVCTALLSLVGEEKEFATRCGRVRAEATAAYPELRGDPNDPLPVIRGPATSSNSLVFYGRRLLLKLFRRLETGVNPDYEIGRYLTEETRFDRLPRVAGAITYCQEGTHRPVTVALLQELIPNEGDGWQHALHELHRYYERAPRMAGPDAHSPDPRSLLELAEADPPPVVVEAIGGYLNAAATLGRRTAELHAALASNSRRPEFAPESITPDDADALRNEIVTRGGVAFATFEDSIERIPDEIASDAWRLLDEGRTAFDALADRPVPVPDAVKTRIHGDYHLGQVLWVANDYILLDFEGEPTRSVDERRRKFSPMRDVAGMLRSYHYAAYAGLLAFTQSRPDDVARFVPWAELWQQWVAATFLKAYLETAEGAAFVPRDRSELAELLDGFMLAKAFYELSYELNNRPDWVRIPLGGVLALLERSSAELQRSEVGGVAGTGPEFVRRQPDERREAPVVPRK